MNTRQKYKITDSQRRVLDGSAGLYVDGVSHSNGLVMVKLVKYPTGEHYRRFHITRRGSCTTLESFKFGPGQGDEHIKGLTPWEEWKKQQETQT